MGRYYDLVIFDMDGVLTKCRSSWGYVHDVMGVDNEASLEAFVKGEIDEKEFMRRDIKLWIDKDPDIRDLDIARIVRDMPVIDGLQETVACLRYNRIKSVICSGGIGHAAKMIAEEYGFDGYIADNLETYPDGRLTGEGILNVDLKDKGIAARTFIEKYGTAPERTVSVGNSFTDIAMFRCTGTSIAFNPTDEMTETAAAHVVKSGNIADILDIIMYHEGE